MRLLILLLLSPFALMAQTTKLIKVAVPNYGDVNVVIHYPAAASATNKMPAVVYVPGLGESNTNYMDLYKNQGPLNWYQNNGNKFPSDFILVGAQPRYPWPGAPFLTAVLKELQKPEYFISSFSGTGLSSGAYAWIKYMKDGYSVPLTGVTIMGYEFMGQTDFSRYKSVNTWLFNGLQDGGSIESMQTAFAAMKSQGVNVRGTWYQGGHCCWNNFYNPAYKEDGKNIYEFMLGRATPTTPPVVTPPVASRRIKLALNGTGKSYTAGSLAAGDTVEVSGNGTYISLTGLKGITIVPGGTVTLSNGFDIKDCEGITIDGQYKITVEGKGTGAGLSVTGKTKNIVARDFTLRNLTYGVWAKNEASCDQSLNFPANVQDGLTIDGLRIDKMVNQGMYIGSTDANNNSRPITCNGVSYNYLPSRLANVRITGNFITNTGRPGIQVSAAYAGDNIIEGNTVRNTGVGSNDAQGAGITIGAYTRALIRNNDVDSTGSWNIHSTGSGIIRIENNTLNNAGYNSTGGQTWASAIGIQTIRTEPIDSAFLTITGNKIGRYRHPQAIDLGNVAGTLSTTSTVCGNTTADGKEATVNKTAAVVVKPCGVVVVPPVEPTRKVLRIITVYTDGTVEYK